MNITPEDIKWIAGSQIASLVAFIIASFVLYRTLIQQKDAVIQLLKEQIQDRENKIQDLQQQSPDALGLALNERIDMALKELERLKEEKQALSQDIEQKEFKQQKLIQKLDALHQLVLNTDLVCPECNAPLADRYFHTIYGAFNGQDVEYEEECLTYTCGRSVKEHEVIVPCGAKGST